MADDNRQFTATVDNWCKQSLGRMEAIFKESTQRTISIAQAVVPVDTGYLRASVQASLSQMPLIDPSSRPTKGASFPALGGEVTATIASAKLGGTIYVGYTASYAGYVEYGTSRTPARGYVAQAVMQWPATVSQVVRELRGRVGQ